MKNGQTEQRKLFKEVLKRFQKAGILESVILIGSWCIPLYKKYFEELKTVSPMRTRDMDFLVPLDAKFENKVDIAALLKDLGFKTVFQGQHGYMRLVQPYLILEFLVAEKGRGTEKPYNLSALSVNAQRLRMLDMLTEETIQIEVDGIEIILPHPVLFALHKLTISSRRSGKNKIEKAGKDKKVAIEILNAFAKEKYLAPIKGLFNSLHKNRQKEIISILYKENEEMILNILKS